MARGIGVLLLFLMVAPGCVSEQQEPARDDAAADTLHFLNVSNEVAFVGDEACASCHEDLYQSYQTHGMAQSFAPVTEDKVPAVFADTVRYPGFAWGDSVGASREGRVVGGRGLSGGGPAGLCDLRSGLPCQSWSA